MSIAFFWIAAGLVLGCVQALGIWGSTRNPTSTANVLVLWRVIAVGLVLALAAARGSLLAATAGWAIAFFGVVLSQVVYKNERTGDGFKT